MTCFCVCYDCNRKVSPVHCERRWMLCYYQPKGVARAS